MKKLLIAASMIAMGTTSALAADLPARTYSKAPIAAPVFTWTGFYLGVNLGGAASGGSVTSDPSSTIGGTGAVNSNDLFKSGITGGVQGGYNLQVTPNWVLGVEGDINWLSSKRTTCDINDCGAGSPLIFTTRTDYLATARGRLGYAWDRSLIYVTGGLAIADVRDSFNFFSNTVVPENRNTKTGYAIGGGIETALAGNWSVKAEYLYADVGTDRVFTPAGTGYLDFKHEYHVGRLGLNYKFGGIGY